MRSRSHFRSLVAGLACVALGGAVWSPAALAKHDKNYSVARTACSSLPKDKLALGLGLASDASDAQIAAAYARKQKGSAAKRRSAKAGCLAGLKHHH